MDLTFGFQLQQCSRKDLRQRGKILDGCGEDDGVKGKPLYNTRIEITAHEFEIGLVLKDPRGLLQYRKVPVEAQDAMAGDG
jgi:hypothetical protein